MDQSALIKIARLRTLAARKGKAFDVVRFVGERAFAKQVLTDLMDTDDEDMLVLGLQLLQALDVMGDEQSATPPAPKPAAPAAPAAPDPDKRYVGRLR